MILQMTALGDVPFALTLYLLIVKAELTVSFFFVTIQLKIMGFISAETC